MSNTLFYAVMLEPGSPPERLEFQDSSDIYIYRKMLGSLVQLVPWRAPYIVYANLDDDKLPFNCIVNGREVMGPMLFFGDASSGIDRGLTAEEAEEVMRLTGELPRTRSAAPEPTSNANPLSERETEPALPDDDAEPPTVPPERITSVFVQPGCDPEALTIPASNASYERVLGGVAGQVPWDAPFLLYTPVATEGQIYSSERLLTRVVPSGERKYAVPGPMLIVGDAGDGTPRSLSAGEVEEAKRLVREMPQFPVWFCLTRTASTPT